MPKRAFRHLALIAVLAVCLALGLAAGGSEPNAQAGPSEDDAAAGEPVADRWQLQLTDAEFEILVERAQRFLPRNPRPQPPDATAVMTCLAQAGGAAADGCRLAESISRLPPCNDLDDCPAYDAWRQLYGQDRPQIVPAVPRPSYGRPMAASVQSREDE